MSWHVLTALALSLATAGPYTALELAPPGEPGVRLTVRARVIGPDGRPLPGVKVHAYQTDVSGRYTPERAMDEPHARLSGWTTTDAHGRFELHTIRPGGYRQPVRLDGVLRHIPAHIHLDLSPPALPARRLQAVFADDPLLADPYWQNWVARLRQPVLRTHAEPGGLGTDLTITLE